jgi:predicted NAD-dependent protein-ADP-ribosyltransferase YbiA (DUF1768 family)
MDKASYFIENKALFGGYPTQTEVEEYEDNGVRYFINLTEEGEKGIEPYTTKYVYIHYPIKDRKVPIDWISFSEFIIRISEIIKTLNGEKVFLSCKGGHGRSGIVVACLLCYIYEIEPNESIEKTSNYHNMRKNMRDKWRKIGSPQTMYQKKFIAKFFNPLHIYSNNNNYFSYGFSNESDLPVNIPELGIFPTAISAYYALKNPFNNNYIKSLEKSTEYSDIENIFENEPTNEDWENNKEIYMYKVLSHKFNQHPHIKQYLINTGLRPIIFYSKDLYLGKSLDGLGKNMLGVIIMKIRRNIYISPKN